MAGALHNSSIENALAQRHAAVWTPVFEGIDTALDSGEADGRSAGRHGYAKKA
ncbi:MAG: hypothetical protein M3O28_07485 [Actinomycetota bacterium]|nr:hypothetical protein [Actinomycetota bacterium]